MLKPKLPAPSSPFTRYLVALAAVAIATLGLAAMAPESRAPVAVYLGAVLIATWLGGGRAGCFAAAVAVVAFAAILPVIEPDRALVSSLLRLFLLGMLALLVVVILTSERRALVSLQAAQDELRRNNEALRESEYKLCEAEQLANMGYWERDPVSGRIHWSAQASRIFGRPSPAAVVSDAELMEMIHPDDRQRRTETFNDALKGRRPYDIEYRIVRPDGEIRHVHVRESAGGNATRFGTVQDITERRCAEIALRKSEQLLRDAETLGQTGSWEHNLVTGEIVNSESNARLFFGDDRGKGARFEDFAGAVHPDDRAYVQSRHAQLIAEGGPRDIEYRVVWPDGSVHVIFGRATVVRDEAGRPVRVYGANIDVTQRKATEDALRDSQQLLQQVLATLPVGVVVTNPGGDIMLSNAAAAQIWGADLIISGPERRARSQAWWHDTGLKIEADDWASKRAIMRGQTSLNELIDIETFGGQRKTIQNSAAPIRKDGGAIAGAVIVNEDVTVRVVADKALREYARRLQHLSRRLLEIQEDERRRLALELHDEFGQLLATINLRLHAALRAAGEAARPGLEESMALLQQAGDEVRNLALELRPTMLENAGLDVALRWLAGQHQQRTGIITEVAGHAGEVSGAASIACFRVVQEALTNVVRHSKASKVRIEIGRTESALDLTIADDGVGFDVETVAGQAAGRGSLGLLGMRERVQVLGGAVEVSSQPGAGTRVRVWLPFVSVEAAAP